MAEHDFEVRLSCTARPAELHVIWQPDAIVHPDRRVGGVLEKPPAETHVIRFETAQAATAIRQDIRRLLTEEGQQVPPLLDQDCLVGLYEMDSAHMARHSIAMMYALLSELTATAKEPADVLVYDPSSAICLGREHVRELMNWRDMLLLMDDPLPMAESVGIQDPDFADDRQMRIDSLEKPMPTQPPGQRLATASPGEQRSSLPWGWIAGALVAFAFSAWYFA